MGLATAAWSRMAGDPVLSADLSSYHDEPAVIVTDDGSLPEDVSTPFVAVLGVIVDEPNDCKSGEGRDQSLMIRVFDEADGSTLQVEAIAERVRSLFHRQPLGLASGAYLVECSGPFVTPTDSSLYGRQIEVRVVS